MTKCAVLYVDDNQANFRLVERMMTARTIELEVIPACRYHGLGLVPWSPLCAGMLGGALKKAKEGRYYQRAEKIDKLRPQLERYEALCEELGEQPADVAIAWLLHNPVVTAAITGPRTKEQLVKGLLAVDVVLSGDTLGRLDAIWLAPGGETPGAYAW